MKAHPFLSLSFDPRYDQQGRSTMTLFTVSDSHSIYLKALAISQQRGISGEYLYKPPHAPVNQHPRSSQLSQTKTPSYSKNHGSEAAAMTTTNELEVTEEGKMIAKWVLITIAILIVLAIMYVLRFDLIVLYLFVCVRQWWRYSFRPALAATWASFCSRLQFWKRERASNQSTRSIEQESVLPMHSVHTGHLPTAPEPALVRTPSGRR